MEAGVDEEDHRGRPKCPLVKENYYFALSSLNDGEEPVHRVKSWIDKLENRADTTVKKKYQTTRKKNAGVGEKLPPSNKGGKKIFEPDKLPSNNEDDDISAESLRMLDRVEEDFSPLFINVVPVSNKTPAAYKKLQASIDEWRDKAYVLYNTRDDIIRPINPLDKTTEYQQANYNVVKFILNNTSQEYLDLHFAPVYLAIWILDIFVDWHIRRMMRDPRAKNQWVEIVTGRGNNSKDGVPKIKNAVFKRLAMRGVKFKAEDFKEINQGGAFLMLISRELKFCMPYDTRKKA